MTTTTPAHTLMIDHSFAFSEACCAPATSPIASLEFTWLANTMPTMPVGRQQNSVARIECTR